MKKDSKPEKTLKKTGNKSITEEIIDLNSTKDYKKINKELIARANYAEMELAKLQLEKESFDTVKKRLKEEISCLKAQHESDELKIKELNYTISQMGKTLSEIEFSATETNREQQKALEKLKSSLADVESVVSYRATTSRRHLSKISRLINSFFQNTTEGSPQLKASIKKLTKEVTFCVEELGKIVNNNKLEPPDDNLKDTLREKEQTIEEYRKTLEKMREQMQLLRERVKELENQPSKKGSIDNDKKIKALIQEKESLARHVDTLEQSLREQSLFMQSLKDTIFVEENKSDIDEEIALVDREIFELQSSLDRALS
jgi:chromosome segregation ATPase